MINKVNVLVDDIIGDFQSCWYFATHIVSNPPIDKRVAIIGAVIILIIPLFVISNENDIFLYFVRVLFASLATFAILTWSNTFWFLFKKMWMYKIHVKMRKSINYYVKDIKNLKIDDEEVDHPEGAIYVISQYNSTGIGYHIVRNGIEVAALLIILLVTLPYFFLFNLALFFMQFFYVMIFDNQSSSQVFSDLKTLVFCVHKLYKDNPENCKKFIYENTMESVRDLGAIYRAIDKS